MIGFSFTEASPLSCHCWAAIALQVVPKKESQSDGLHHGDQDTTISPIAGADKKQKTARSPSVWNAPTMGASGHGYMHEFASLWEAF